MAASGDAPGVPLGFCGGLRVPEAARTDMRVALPGQLAYLVAAFLECVVCAFFFGLMHSWICHYAWVVHVGLFAHFTAAVHSTNRFPKTANVLMIWVGTQYS